ncbi:hypothetical protein [Pedobacter sp. L105]|uniref:hypothetical protein n=1 Tax=Pedobacter sp. L105 TaxID=1641871 RepID=UPI00131BA3C6|nr:hypothetical protein [Pedobacter sp. L105]
MKVYLSSKNCLRLSIFLILALFYLSCKKNNDANIPSNNVSDISQAKVWYDSLYSTSQKINSSTLSTIKEKGVIKNYDLNQVIKPNWNNPTSYKKFGQNVIEMNIDPSNKFSSMLKNNLNNLTNTNPAYSKSSYILVNDGSGYQAYIMTLIADSSYLKGDIKKLANNTYRKRDIDYSGLVLYFTPKGKYVSGYRYKNGTLVNPQSQTNKSVSNGTLSIMSAPVDCYDYYLVSYTNGVETSSEYLFTECGGGDDAGGGGGGGSGGSGGGGDGTGGSGSSGPTPPALPCHISTNGALSVNSAPVDPGPGQGFPNPAPCIEYTGAREIVNQMINPCMKSTVDLILSNNINIMGEMSEILNKFGDKNGTIIHIVEDNTLHYDDGSPKSGASEAKAIDAQGNGIAGTIWLNASYLDSTSVQSVAATLIHEFVHSYITYKNDPILTSSHDVIAAKYVDPMAVFFQAKFKMPALDAYALAWSGIPDSDIMKNAKANRDAELFTMTDGTKFTYNQIISQEALYNFQGNGALGQPVCH